MCEISQMLNSSQVAGLGEPLGDCCVDAVRKVNVKWCSQEFFFLFFFTVTMKKLGPSEEAEDKEGSHFVILMAEELFVTVDFWCFFYAAKGKVCALQMN